MKKNQARLKRALSREPKEVQDEFRRCCGLIEKYREGHPGDPNFEKFDRTLYRSGEGALRTLLAVRLQELLRFAGFDVALAAPLEWPNDNRPVSLIFRQFLE